MKNQIASALLTVTLIIFAYCVQAQTIPPINSSAYDYIPEHIKAEIRTNVDWSCSRDDGFDPRRMDNQVIIATPRGNWWGVRGTTGGRSCANIGILYAMIGQREAGFSWFVATQSHNPSVANLYSQYADYTLAYAISQYGDKAIREGFATMYGGVMIQLINNFLRR